MRGTGAGQSVGKGDGPDWIRLLQRGEREKLSDTGWSKRIRNRLQMLPVNKTALLRSVTLNSFAQILSYRTTLSEGGRRVEVTSNEVGLMRLDE